MKGQEHPHEPNARQQAVQATPPSSGGSIDISLIGKEYCAKGRFYYARASLGTSGQTVDLMVDTGSTDTWVYGEQYCSAEHKKDETQCCKTPIARESPLRIYTSILRYSPG